MIRFNFLPRRGNRFLRSAGVLVALLAACAPVTARAWWNSEWTIRKRITLDTTPSGAAISEPIGAVPVLLRLHDGIFRFDAAKSDGSDLRFIAEDDKTLLPYHIEKFDPLLNEAFVWVKVPEVKPSAKTTVWLYYGNVGNKATKVEDPKGTYDDQTVLVYHFSEHGQPAFDSSGGGNTAQNSGLNAEGAIIGSGLRFDGKSSVVIPAAPALAWSESSSFTWSAWVKPATSEPNTAVFSRRQGRNAFVVGVDSGIPFVELTDASGTQRTASGAPLPAGAWKHLAVIAGDGRVTLYVDGDPYASLGHPVPAMDGSSAIGAGYAGNAGFSGELDELEIAKTARPIGAVKIAAVGQGGEKATKLITLGDDEQQTGFLSALKTGYVGIIIGSLSVDGWVVIGILLLMSAISWIVMVRKGQYLNRIGKGNVHFLNEWSHVAGDLSVLDEGDIDDAKTMGGRLGGASFRSMREAPLYKIYHIGVEEIRHRINSDDGGGGTKVLSARSIQAIRASLDGGLVRETQRLNSQMVLLTIAISGGPFLGLLGTVVGVMITFAAVAAAGDVNVNAIAPGIAAALAATVAGLAVAIPALFGYNYLLTRIKSVTTDMHVFIDEFVTKLAEFYSGGAD